MTAFEYAKPAEPYLQYALVVGIVAAIGIMTVLRLIGAVQLIAMVVALNLREVLERRMQRLRGAFAFTPDSVLFSTKGEARQIGVSLPGRAR